MNHTYYINGFLIYQMDLERNYTGDEKDNQKRYLHHQHKETDIFIKKSYWLCLILFLVSGIAMVSAVTAGVYKDVVLAETFIVSVLGTTYMVLFIIMICCYGNAQLRIATLLFVSTFIGVVAGFMIGVNLKMVVSHLKE